MKKFLLALGLAAAIASPAAAGRLDNTDPTLRDVPAANAVQASDVDYTTTRAIHSVEASHRFDKQRGDQGSAFGANGR